VFYSKNEEAQTTENHDGLARTAPALAVAYEEAPEKPGTACGRSAGQADGRFGRRAVVDSTHRRGSVPSIGEGSRRGRRLVRWQKQARTFGERHGGENNRERHGGERGGGGTEQG
jgi:transcription initiation factor TFIID subunit TAF12